MQSHSEHVHQLSIRKRLEARGSGFTPFDLTGIETIPALFDWQMAHYPYKPAVSYAGETTTYYDLYQRSCDIGCAVRREQKDRSSPIALLFENPANFLAAALGVLRCGQFYIPLDPSLPDDCISHILRKCRVRLIFTERASPIRTERVKPSGSVLVYVDDISDGYPELPDRSDPDDLAYVAFTFDAKHCLKGVMQSQCNVLQAARRWTNSLCLGTTDCVGLLTTDFPISPLFGTLLNGATLIGPPVLCDHPGTIANWLDSEQITLLHSAPSLFRHFMVNVASTRVFPEVQVVCFGGESVLRSDWELFKQHFPARSVLVNTYGCSEMSTVTGFYMDAASRFSGNTVPAGYPLEDIEIAVARCDGSLQWAGDLCGPGGNDACTGEIVLRSRYLSQGYWNDPIGTAMSFSAQRGPTRLLRTGVFGTLRDRGLLYAGQTDLPAEVSGFHIELARLEPRL